MTSPQNEPQPPVLDGWTVRRHDTAPTWTADRTGGLSDVEVEYGCQMRVTATSFGELEVRCLAEDIKCGIVQAAERMAERLLEADAERGGRTWRNNGPGTGLSV